MAPPNEKPNRILQQIPLIISPSYRPPQPHKLGVDVHSYPTHLPFPLDAAEGQLTLEAELERWAQGLERQLTEIKVSNEQARLAFVAWKEAQLRQYAPGFEDAVLVPLKKVAEEPKRVAEANHDLAIKRPVSPALEAMSELDQVFGAVDINT